MVELAWYPQASNFLKITHHLHTAFEKSIIIERTIQYIKDRTEMFDDYYYPCRKAGLCNLRHVQKWLTLFVFMHNSIVKSRSKFDNMMRWMHLN
jgi:putative transposase